MRAFAAVALKEPRTKNTLAILCICFRRPFEVDEVDRVRLEALISRASGRLQTVWLLMRYRKLAQVGFSVNQNLQNYEELFKLLYEESRGILDIQHFFALGIYNWQEDTVNLHYCLKHHCGQRSVTLSENMRRIFAERESFFLATTASTSPIELDDGGPQLSPKSVIYVPLLLRHTALGFLTVQHETASALDHEDLAVMELMANHAAAAVSGIRLFKNQLDLNRTGLLLADQEEPARALEDVVRRIREATRADVVILHPYHAKLDKMSSPSVWDGELNEPEALDTRTSDKGDLSYLLIRKERPLFLHEASSLAEALGADSSETARSFQAREGIASVSAVPLRFQSDPVGALFLNFRRAQPFDGAQKQLISGLSVFAAIAIQNARLLLERDRRRLDELKVLQEIDREIAETADHKEVLNTILECSNTILKADDASILLAESDEGEPKLRMVAAIGRYAEMSIGWTTRDADHSVVKWVLENKTSALIKDIEADEEWEEIFLKVRSNTRAELDVPFRDGDEVIGVLNFESTTPGAFDKNDQEFAETLARQVLLAIKRAQEAKVASRRAAERGLLMDLSREIIGEIEHEKLLPRILEKAISTAEAEAGVLLLYDEENEELEVVCEQGVPDDNCGERFTFDQGIIGRVARYRHTLNIDPTEPQWREYHLPYVEGVRSQLAIPLLEGDRLWGVLNIESTKPGQFRDREKRLTSSLANFAVIALQNAERLRETESRQNQLRALQSVTRQLIGELRDLDEVMQSIVDHAVELIDDTHGAELALWEGGSLTATFFAPKEADSRNFDNDSTEQLGYTGEGVGLVDGQVTLSSLDTPTDSDFLRRVADSQQTLRIRGEACKELLPDRDREVQSALAAPLIERTNQELQGVLAVKSREPYAFRNSDEEILELFADEAVLAIQIARSYKSLERELKRFDSLVRAGEELGKFSDVNDLPKAYDLVLEKAAEQCECLSVVRRHDPDGEELVLISQAGAPASEKLFERMKVDKGLNGLVFKTRNTQYQPDTANPAPGSPPAKLSDTRFRSVVITPIQFGDSYYGNLGLSHLQDHHFDSADILLAEGLAQLLAITWHRLLTIQRQRELEYQAQETEIMSAFDQASFELAHRLNGDLGIVRPRVQMIQERLKKLGVSDEKIDDNLDRIVKRTSNLIALNESLREEVQSFLAGEPQKITVLEIFSDAREDFDDEPPSVQILFDLKPETSEVLAVPDFPQQILHNLIRNAIEAVSSTGEGVNPSVGMVEISARNAGSVVEIRVQDDGAGIPSPDRDKIFNLLFSTKKSTGFGLWSARRKAKLCGGDLLIDQESTERGTIFCLKLPRADLPPEARFHG